ncbi:hypothetical protein J6590_091483, partial [Homalodisca vitripennis]
HYTNPAVTSIITSSVTSPVHFWSSSLLTASLQLLRLFALPTFNWRSPESTSRLEKGDSDNERRGRRPH